MMIYRFLLSALFLLPGVAISAESNPPTRASKSWMTDATLANLKKIGINPDADLEKNGNYHSMFRAKKPMVLEGYSCPAGTTVSVSKNIVLILANKDNLCSGSKGGKFESLKLLPDGKAEPIEGSAR